MSWGSRRLPRPTWYNRSVTTDPLLAALAAAQDQHQLFAQRPAAVVVGVSGGADSVCLLHALAALAAPWSLTLHVAHVNHALRPSADRDAAFVGSLAQRLGLPFHSLTLAPGELDRQPGGREAAGRAARQRFLHATAINVTPPGQVPHVALAHHADDQAETVLLRLVQGAGLAGLGGMRPVTSFQQPGAPADALVLPMGDIAPAIALAETLRSSGLRVQLYCEQKKFKQKMAYADKLKVPFAVLLGEDEIAEGKCSVKDMKTGEQLKLTPAEAAEHIKASLDAETGTLILEK